MLGIVTNRDMRFAENDATPVSVMMTTNDLAVLTEPADLDEARSLMKARRIEKLLVTDGEGKLTGLLTLKDSEQAVLNPQACKDHLGRLRVAAATTVGDAGHERSEALMDAGVDVVVIDTAHGHSDGVVKAVTRAKKLSNEVQIIAGNVATGEAAQALIDAGADAVKVGIGPGSICTTRVVAWSRRSATHGDHGLRGGCRRHTRDRGWRDQVFRRLCKGHRGRCVQCYGWLTGCRNRRIAWRTDSLPGPKLQVLQGHGFLGCHGRGSADRYFQTDAASDKLVPEGVEGQVPYKGPATTVIHQLIGGLRAAMGYTGCETVEEMRKELQVLEDHGGWPEGEPRSRCPDH